MRLSAIIVILLLLAACEPSKVPQTRLVEVPSSKPYQYIRWSLEDTDETKRQVRAHNRAHQAVIDAERAKAAQ